MGLTGTQQVFPEVVLLKRLISFVGNPGVRKSRDGFLLCFVLPLFYLKITLGDATFLTHLIEALSLHHISANKGIRHPLKCFLRHSLSQLLYRLFLSQGRQGWAFFIFQDLRVYDGLLEGSIPDHSFLVGPWSIDVRYSQKLLLTQVTKIDVCLVSA